MYCTHCGNELDNKAVICPKCGCIANKTAYDAAFRAVSQNNDTAQNSAGSSTSAQPPQAQKIIDKPNPAFSILSCFIPIFGIVVYLAEHTKTPIACKRYLIWSIASILLTVLFIIAYIGMIAVLIALDMPVP
ncbi:MAG: zinc-ribbon domain-containing protein [Oscillospiraceae bacterium]|nr:zinc-ribbon domain-containing protein [Oscillospiraceae bacterium]